MQNFNDIRVFFSKTDECKYIGHLDVNRIITRAIQKSKLPIWKTEGFNVHTYITFSNPLSLGFASTCESFDIRIIDENYDINRIPEMLNQYLPEGLKILSVSKPEYKNKDITSAEYEIKISSDDISNEELYSLFKNMLESKEIIVGKKTKKGSKEINLSDFLSVYTIELKDKYVFLNIILPSGSTLNINPNLFFDKIKSDNNIELFTHVLRTRMFVNGNEFK